MATDKGKKMSIFAQKMLREKEEKLKTNKSSESSVVGNCFGDKSFIVMGSDAFSIHEENIKTLSGMTSDEIEAERKKLLAEMNPQTVEFLKQKRTAQKNNGPIETPMDQSSDNPKATTTNVIPVEEVPDVKEFVNKYPHMSIVENEKLQWMGELKNLPPSSDKAYNARFNFEGQLLPYSDEGEGILKGLHNHGDEQERPGYTLQELIQMSRSSFLQQRVIALNTLAKILANARDYEICFDKPVLPALLEANTFILLRFSLDDSSLPVIMAATLAMCNLIVNHTDENCLDLMLGMRFGVQQPSLGVVLEMKPSDIEELKDTELLGLDLVRGAMRTDILPRIRFILDKLKPEPLEVKHILKTITRMARHSYEIALGILTSPNLLQSIRNVLSRPGSSYFPEALKLFRVLIARSHSFAEQIHDNYSLLNHIFQFITGEKAQGHPEAMHLILESFYTWQTLLQYNIGLETIGELTPVLMKLLETHFGLTTLQSSNSDLEHATAIITTLSAVPYSHVSQYHPLILKCSMKWISKLLFSNDITLSGAKLIGASLQHMAHANSYFDTRGELIPMLETFLKNSNFLRMAHKLRKHSWLLSGTLGLNIENLPCLGSFPPFLDPHSVLPLIQGLASYVLTAEHLSLTKLFIHNAEILNYIEEIIENPNVHLLCGHWYARQELSLLATIANLHSTVQGTDHSPNDAQFHSLAFLLLSIVQSGDKYFLPHIFSRTIFSTNFFRNRFDILTKQVNEMNISDTPKDKKHTYLIDVALSDLDKIERVYSRELGLDGLVPVRPPPTLTGLLNSTQPALPKDWPYLPIMRLHNTNGVGKDSTEVAIRTLQWILLLEETCKEKNYKLVGTSSAAKYCRLSCIFLAGNDLFRDMTELLEANLKTLLKSNSDFNFEEPVPGLTSFYDFYRELLEQFAGVSYCDPIFGQYILVPLQQRHDPKYKKLIWFELSAIIRLLSTPTEDVDMTQYLEPCETDHDLLMVYLRSLATGRVRIVWSPVLYAVAVHHVAMFVKNDSNAAKTLLGRIQKLGNNELREMLENYEGPGSIK